MKAKKLKEKYFLWPQLRTFLRGREGVLRNASSRSGKRLTHPFLLTEAFPWTQKHDALGMHLNSGYRYQKLSQGPPELSSGKPDRQSFLQLSLRLSVYLSNILTWEEARNNVEMYVKPPECWALQSFVQTLIKGLGRHCKGLPQCQELKSCTCFCLTALSAAIKSSCQAVIHRPCILF